MTPPSLVAVLIAVAAAFLADTAAIRAQDVEIRTSVDTTRITVGDRIELAVGVDHPAGSRVAWPDSLELAPFEVLGRRITEGRGRDGRPRSEAIFTLTVFELGALEIPPFDVAVVTVEGERRTLATDRFGIEVVSVGVEEGGEIREIRGPLAIPLGPTTLALLGALILAAAGAAFLLFRWLARRGEPAPAGTERPDRPPHEVALERLARVEASTLLEQGRVKEYHIAISEIVRTYIERRFRVRALEMTTVEVLTGLAETGVDEVLLPDLERFLGACDLVKFAKARPSAETSGDTLRLGRDFVVRSKPEPPAAALEGAARADGEGTPEIADREREEAGTDADRPPPEPAEVG